MEFGLRTGSGRLFQADGSAKARRPYVLSLCVEIIQLAGVKSRLNEFNLKCVAQVALVFRSFRVTHYVILNVILCAFYELNSGKLSSNRIGIDVIVRMSGVSRRGGYMATRSSNLRDRAGHTPEKRIFQMHKLRHHVVGVSIAKCV